MRPVLERPESAVVVSRPRLAYKWIALSNTTIGMLMATVNATSILIAMPVIFRGININPLDPANFSYLLWLLMGYMVVSAVLVVTAGRLGDMFGRTRIYNIGFAIFTLAVDRTLAGVEPGCGGRDRADRPAHGSGRRRRDGDGELGGDTHRRVSIVQRGFALGINMIAAMARVVPRHRRGWCAGQHQLALDLPHQRADRHASAPSGASGSFARSESDTGPASTGSAT